jgi:hypothetical protein
MATLMKSYPCFCLNGPLSTALVHQAKRFVQAPASYLAFLSSHHSSRLFSSSSNSDDDSKNREDEIAYANERYRDRISI